VTGVEVLAPVVEAVVEVFGAVVEARVELCTAMKGAGAVTPAIKAGIMRPSATAAAASKDRLAREGAEQEEYQREYGAAQPYDSQAASYSTRPQDTPDRFAPLRSFSIGAVPSVPHSGHLKGESFSGLLFGSSASERLTFIQYFASSEPLSNRGSSRLAGATPRARVLCVDERLTKNSLNISTMCGRYVIAEPPYLRDSVTNLFGVPLRELGVFTYNAAPTDSLPVY
jgi:hypothetical protein